MPFPLIGRLNTCLLMQRTSGVHRLRITMMSPRYSIPSTVPKNVHLQERIHGRKEPERRTGKFHESVFQIETARIVVFGIRYDGKDREIGA